MSNQQTSMADEIRKRSYLVRTEEQLWDALQRFISRDRVMSIPVNPERDADCILGDGIKELMALRAKVAEQENTIANLKAGNVRSITYPTIPAHLRVGTFKTQDESATTRGPSGFTISANPNLTDGTVVMLTHPTQARPELICARCGGWHPYMQQVIAIKDGVVGQAEWVGCTGPKAPTDGNQGEGDTP